MHPTDTLLNCPYIDDIRNFFADVKNTENVNDFNYYSKMQHTLDNADTILIY